MIMAVAAVKNRLKSLQRELTDVSPAVWSSPEVVAALIVSRSIEEGVDKLVQEMTDLYNVIDTVRDRLS
jgi:hypothetical protein